MNLSRQVIEKLGHYVYLYIDPRDESVFYVGKGSGNRCLTHLSEGGETEKVKRIASIHASGSKPRIDILVHGLSAETAFQVEAAVIDLFDREQLTNKVGGQGLGRMELKQIISRYDQLANDVRDFGLVIAEGEIAETNHEEHRGVVKFSFLGEDVNLPVQYGKTWDGAQMSYEVLDGVELFVYVDKTVGGSFKARGAEISDESMIPEPGEHRVQREARERAAARKAKAAATEAANATMETTQETVAKTKAKEKVKADAQREAEKEVRQEHLGIKQDLRDFRFVIGHGEIVESNHETESGLVKFTMLGAEHILPVKYGKTWDGAQISYEVLDDVELFVYVDETIDGSFKARAAEISDESMIPEPGEHRVKREAKEREAARKAKL